MWFPSIVSWHKLKNNVSNTIQYCNEVHHVNSGGGSPPCPPPPPPPASYTYDQTVQMYTTVTVLHTFPVLSTAQSFLKEVWDELAGEFIKLLSLSQWLWLSHLSCKRKMHISWYNYITIPYVFACSIDGLQYVAIAALAHLHACIHEWTSCSILYSHTFSIFEGSPELDEGTLGWTGRWMGQAFEPQPMVLVRLVELYTIKICHCMWLINIWWGIDGSTSKHYS